MTVDHYENFPVASRLLPRRLREPVAAIYGFARSADDIADEGEFDDQVRLSRLDGYRAELAKIAAGLPSEDPLFRRLAAAIAGHELPLAPFSDLLDAFSQDVVKKRYADFAELMDYCRRSANPVGRLLLRLYRAESQEQLIWSDAICSSLQLINHWQDVGPDLARGRIYLPSEDMERFAVTEAQLASVRADENWRSLLRFEVDRARAMMLAGSPLGRTLPGRIGLELNLIVAGGLRILEKIEAVDYDVFHRRPVLQPIDWPLLMWRALCS
jgi:squalene synthase HpnC